MSTKPPVRHNANGTFAKGCRSPNPNGRPKKAAIAQFSPFAETLVDFAGKPVELVKNGKEVSQSRAEWVAERHFQQVMAGEAPAERFLRTISEADSIVHARYEEFMQDAVSYKLIMTAKKRSLPPGTPWNPADGLGRGPVCRAWQSIFVVHGLKDCARVAILHMSYIGGIGPMASVEKLTTTVSTKGQVILPSAIRQRREWSPGTRLVVEETPDGVLLKPAPVFAETRPEDVFGSLRYRGKPKTIEEMNAGVLAEAKRRHARD